MQQTQLEVKQLSVYFHKAESEVTALDQISFQVKEGEMLAIVGESGCGKSVLAHSILRLLDEKRTTSYSGEIVFQDTDLLKLSYKEMQKIRGDKISMIFQNPLTSLNPVHTIGKQIKESILLHQKISNKEAEKRAINLLKLIGIPDPDKRIKEFPHQLSGGMRQRIMIALALACNPSLLIADEPTTALDVTIQSQIMDLITDLNKQLNMSVMLITHDLGIVAETCQRVIVLYLGQIVEIAEVQDLFDAPYHPYSSALIQSIPRIDSDRTEEMYTLEGSVPSLENITVGCRFASRCSFSTDQCRKETPQLKSIDDSGRLVRCWYPLKTTEKLVVI